jgi:ribosomal-protein-serine acetyltransferase
MFVCRAGDTVTLALLEVRHAEALFERVNENRLYLRQWFSWVDYHQTLLDSHRFIVTALNQYAQNSGFHAGIWYLDQLVGVIGHAPRPIDWGNRVASLNWWLAPSVHGKGILGASIRAMLQHAFDELRLNRVEFRCVADHARSRAMAEKQGFLQECILRQGQQVSRQYKDVAVYGFLAEQWQLDTAAEIS